MQLRHARVVLRNFPFKFCLIEKHSGSYLTATLIAEDHLNYGQIRAVPTLPVGQIRGRARQNLLLCGFPIVKTEAKIKEQNKLCLAKIFI